MQTVFGYALSMLAEKSVSGRRAITREDVERVLGLQLCLDGPEQVKQASIYRFNLVGAKITKYVVDLSKGARQMRPFVPEDRVETFSSMDIVERKGPFRCKGLLSARKGWAREQCRTRNKDTQPQKLTTAEFSFRQVRTDF